jgi:hypothetical protein
MNPMVQKVWDHSAMSLWCRKFLRPFCHELWCRKFLRPFSWTVQKSFSNPFCHELCRKFLGTHSWTLWCRKFLRPFCHELGCRSFWDPSLLMNLVQKVWDSRHELPVSFWTLPRTRAESFLVDYSSWTWVQKVSGTHSAHELFWCRKFRSFCHEPAESSGTHSAMNSWCWVSETILPWTPLV